MELSKVFGLTPIDQSHGGKSVAQGLKFGVKCVGYVLVQGTIEYKVEGLKPGKSD